MEVICKFPEKMDFLFRPAPYKVAYGGRGGAKTWSYCRALAMFAANKKLFILCAREIQKSIKDSVHKLLAEQIYELGLGDRFTIGSQNITGNNGSRFSFAGIRNNIAAIKSMEGIDICAVFEATYVSERSWEFLLPTIRRDPPHGPFRQGSEVWVEFNPELATDYTYQYWVADPPESAVVREINYWDNPWFPEILSRQMEEMRKGNYDRYLTVWCGQTARVLEGAIYARELLKAHDEKRINPNIKIDPSKPVDVVFDLGRSDMCAMWFMQQVGTEHHAIKFYGNVGYGMDHYFEEIDHTGWRIGRILLPHDARNYHQAAANTIEYQCQERYGADKVFIVKNIGIANGIAAVRNLFPRLYFHTVECADGLMALQHYQYQVDPETKQRSMQPLHNWASNPSDSLRYYAVFLVEGYDDYEEEKHGPPQWANAPVPNQRWMGR